MPGLPTGLPFNDTLGDTVPPNTPHAVSVSLPTWRANVGYEEGESWVVEKMKCGYPRFFIHPSIQALAHSIVERNGAVDTENAMLFPSTGCAGRCEEFLRRFNLGHDCSSIRMVQFVPAPEKATVAGPKKVQPHVTAVIYPQPLWPSAKAFWQHTGEGITSRRADFCQRALDDGALIEASKVPRSSPPRLSKGPRRYQRPMSLDHTSTSNTTRGTDGTNGLNGTNGHTADPSTSDPDNEPVPDSGDFVEQRFGRNLDIAFATQAKLAIRKRIAGSLTADIGLPQSLAHPTDPTHTRSRDVPSFSVEDVYLYPMGMNAIFHSHRHLKLARGLLPSIMFGFPYVDTLKTLEKFGPPPLFYGHGSSTDLDDLEARLQRGEKYLALYCEFPGNPLLRTPDLARLRHLSKTHDFALVIDETIGNFLNIHVLPYADIVVSSLTKVFSGDSNVMGGSLILNPQSPYHTALKQTLHPTADEEAEEEEAEEAGYEDTTFEEDAIYLERNSRDFATRIARINTNAETIASLLLAHPAVKTVNYPQHNPDRHLYDACRLPTGGYGGLLSATFHDLEDAKVFYDNLETQKGPSLGTNFTLASPYVLLAHYGELEWAKGYGCEESLVRFSVGLEAEGELRRVFGRALEAVEKGRVAS
ncbi:PLP-dependent transferase [Teratosphaeria nubilosa]|uniref:PLP-dependent transferase n=1 Tax=Teratosphaeria nubilosa TaxID=161662 RepID=A0A6G1KYB0_9PEZI|nr:PLP-dependent transferase [Teratosphaeria nubilosa]